MFHLLGRSEVNSMQKTKNDHAPKIGIAYRLLNFVHSMELKAIKKEKIKTTAKKVQPQIFFFS